MKLFDLGKDKKKQLLLGLLGVATPAEISPRMADRIATACRIDRSAVRFWFTRGTWVRAKSEPDLWALFGLTGNEEVEESTTGEPDSPLRIVLGRAELIPKHPSFDQGGIHGPHEDIREFSPTGSALEERKEAPPVTSPFEYDTPARQEKIAHAFSLIEEATQTLKRLMAQDESSRSTGSGMALKGGPRKKPKRLVQS